MMNDPLGRFNDMREMNIGRQIDGSHDWFELGQSYSSVLCFGDSMGRSLAYKFEKIRKERVFSLLKVARSSEKYCRELYI